MKYILTLLIGCVALASCQQQRPHHKHHKHHHGHHPVMKGIVK